MDNENFDDELSPQDFDDLGEIERVVESINCYTDLLKRIDKKCQQNTLNAPVERICRWAAMEYSIYIPPPKKAEEG